MSSTPPPARVQAHWLLSALGLLVLAALCCAYLTLCLLFLQGQWQLLYQPSNRVVATPKSMGLPFTPVAFGANEAGTAELTGWWLPAGPAEGAPRLPSAAQAPPTTVLYLHDRAGSLADTLPALARLHTLGCAVFAIDYRGYGASQPVHPSEAHMIEDVQSALSYLEQTRHLSPGSIVLWGSGIGATLAAQNGQGQRLVLEDVNPSALQMLRQDPRTRLLPLRLLLRDRLNPAPALESSSAPKLFLDDASPNTSTRQLYDQARGPKQIVSTGADYRLRAFLNAR